jgi:EAL domain-containing protein (putative c-di-GMP-specific phosphodiesterase class I)
LENDLKRAIEREEFTVHYQPKVFLENGRIYGFEALARWKHLQRGLVVPDDFILLAEETGLIVPIGRLVLREACRQICRWQERYRAEFPWEISVNLSPKQFQHPRLVEDIAEVLQATEIAPCNLALDITESVMV